MIYLPATDDAQGAARPAPAPATPHGSETILLIEDQAEVRQLVARILGRLGYTVLVAANATEAADLTREHDGRIDLVLSDVIMPDQMGPEIVASLRRDHPSLRVLFMSGYTDQALEGYGVSPEDLALIQKPFTIQGLAARLRQVLDS
jgi:DNA-binding response OmpR family regulator